MLQNEKSGKASIKSFAAGLDFYKLFWLFFIGSILGVIVETIFCLIQEQRLESRQGLIYGPFNLVYGFGALILTISLYPLRKKNIIWSFAGGFVVGSVFEYLCSYVQEMMFGSVSWEYGGSLFNLHGRISLMYSCFWGILGALWMKVLYPRLSGWIEQIPEGIGKPLSWVLLVFMIWNAAISGLAVARQSERRMDIPAETRLEHFLDQVYPDALLSEIYPNMMYPDSLPVPSPEL